MLVNTGLINDIGYASGGAEPVDSSLMTWTHHFPSSVRTPPNNKFITIANDNKYDNSNIPYRLFWDYNHETIMNGQYHDKGNWDKYIDSKVININIGIDDTTTTRWADVDKVSSQNTSRQAYVDYALDFSRDRTNDKIVTEDTIETSNSELNPLHYEPTFLIMKRDLLEAISNGDYDGDGMSDIWEDDNGLNKNNPNDALLDKDEDGLSNLDEFLNDGNPNKEDTDDDGMLDAFEYEYDLNLTKDDTLEDKDKDGVSNIEEYADGTNPSDENSFLPPLLAPNISIEKLTNASIKVTWDTPTTSLSTLVYELYTTGEANRVGDLWELNENGNREIIINNLLANKIYYLEVEFKRFRYPYAEDVVSSKTITIDTRITPTNLKVNAGEDKEFVLGNNAYLISRVEGNDDNLELSYSWKENNLELSTKSYLLKADWELGRHEITLSVSDGISTVEDDVIITITKEPTPSLTLKVTGQNVSYATSDDGDYETGISLNYTKENNAILDRVTGLKWADNADSNSTQRSWDEAKAYCLALGNAWRLPLREELSSLVHYAHYNPAIDKSFVYIASKSYWSSSQSVQNTDNAWVVNFAYGTESTSSKTSVNEIRCVSSIDTGLANAGEDQFIQEGNTITLSATYSIHKELIGSYTWEEDAEVLGTGEVLELDNIRDGEHHITLTIRDAGGNILSIDHIVVTIVSNNKVIKQTGQNISYGSFDDGHIEGGVPLNYTSQDEAILDRATGLLWKDSIESNSSTYTWEEARAYCSGLSGEWRVPMREELSGLVHYGNYNPAIEESFLYIANTSYWTLSTSERNIDSAWTVNFAYGTESTSSKTSQNYLRCISTNSPARANAGEDLFVERGDSFNLDGSNSPHKELISSYTWWIEYSRELGYTEILPITDIFDGEYKILLMIEDDEGNTDIDETLVTIVSKHDKLKVTGQSVSYSDYDDAYHSRGYSLNYTDNGATVSDGVLNILWQNDGDTDSNAQTWKEAKAYCASLTILGSSWRLPTRQELSSIVHYGKYNPAIDSSFDSTANASYWSISTSDKTDKSAWVVNFAYGTESTSSKTSSLYSRCVKTTN